MRGIIAGCMRIHFCAGSIWFHEMEQRMVVGGLLDTGCQFSAVFCLQLGA